MRVSGCHQFRITRDGDLFVVDEAVEDLLLAVAEELDQRRFGDAVRLEIADECPIELTTLLQGEFNLVENEIYPCRGPVNLTRLVAVPEMVNRTDLKFPTFTPSRPPRLAAGNDMFAVIRRGDL